MYRLAPLCLPDMLTKCCEQFAEIDTIRGGDDDNVVAILNDRPGPKYLRIADALSEDIYAGRLAAGDRLPTHRDLAWHLGVTVGTVSRAYAEAERRGLLVGEVGRGSYVKAGARSTATLAMPDPGGPATIELGINKPPAALSAPDFATAMTSLAQSGDLEMLMNYQPHTGRWDHGPPARSGSPGATCRSMRAR